MSSGPSSKRRRMGSAAADVSPPKASDIFAAYEDDPEDVEALLPSDTHAALQFLMNQFPAVSGLSRFPIVLQHTLYTVIHDRGKVDRELDNLLRDGKIRRFDAATGQGHTFVALSHDYHRELARWCTIQERTSRSEGAESRTFTSAAGAATAGLFSSSVYSSSSTAATSSSSSSTSDNSALSSTSQHDSAPISLYARFCKIAQKSRSMSITRLELERRLGEGRHTSEIASKTIDDLLRNLISEGFLTHQTQNISVESYFYSVPGAGLVVRNLIAGRKEMLAILGRAKYREMLRSKMVARNLKKTCFRTDLVLRDLTGSGVVLSVPTTSGPLIRLIDRKNGKRSR